MNASAFSTACANFLLIPSFAVRMSESANTFNYYYVVVSRLRLAIIKDAVSELQ